MSSRCELIRWGRLASTARLFSVTLLVAVFACASLLESSARASCGDYVIVRGQRPAGHAMAHRSHAAGLAATNAEQKNVPMVPCRGPKCRGGLPNQPLPAPVLKLELNDQVACFFRSLSDGDSFLASPTWDRDGAELDGFPPRIERPPRS